MKILVMQNLVKNHQKLIWNLQKGFDFETDKANTHFKMLLRTDSKYAEHVVWLKCISKQMYFKMNKFDVAKQTVLKCAHLKWMQKNQPNGSLLFLCRKLSHFLFLQN